MSRKWGGSLIALGGSLVLELRTMGFLLQLGNRWKLS